MAKTPRAPKGSMVKSPNNKKRYYDAGKGSKSRVSDTDKYEENWEKIFGRKKNRKEEE